MSSLFILTINLHPNSPVHEFNKSVMYKCNYKFVVAVSKQFGNRWIQMYVPWLQIRHRWHEIQPKTNGLVLLKEAKTEGRLDYPKGLAVSRLRFLMLTVLYKMLKRNSRMAERSLDICNIVHLNGLAN